MGEIEITQYLIPLDSYEKHVNNLVNALLKIDEHLFENKTHNLPKEVA